MDYYELDTCPTQDMSFVRLEDEPNGTNMSCWRIFQGTPMGSEYPADAQWFMSDEYPGIKLPSLIANVSSMVIVERRLKDVFAATGVPIEFLPFTLHDHKKRVASRDYFILNVLGTFDCLNLDKSEIEYSEDVPGEVVGIDKYVLDTRKLETAPDIFRVKEEPTMIIVSSRLGKQIQQLTPPVTNVYLIKLEQAEG